MPSTTHFHTIGASEDLRLEVERRGKGSPLLLLPGEEALEREATFLDELAASHEIIMPSPPGFGRSTRPDWITSADDIAYILLELVDQLHLKRVPVIGFSFGAWIAAEMATKDDGFIDRLALVTPYGIKTGGPTDRDIIDIWMQHPDELVRLKWTDPALGKRDFTQQSEDELTIVARNAESFIRFSWDPYMHNPRLKQRLYRVKAPTLLLCGENDGVVTPRYGEAFRALIPNARLAIIPRAGHFPHIEQPHAFMRELRGFIG